MRVLAGVALAAVGANAALPSKLAGRDAHIEAAADQCLNNLRIALSTNGGAKTDSLANFKAELKKIGVPFEGTTGGSAALHLNGAQYPADCDKTDAAVFAPYTGGPLGTTAKRMGGADTDIFQCVMQTSAFTSGATPFATSVAMLTADLDAVFGKVGAATVGDLGLGLNFGVSGTAVARTGIDEDLAGALDGGTADVGAGNLDWIYGVDENTPSTGWREKALAVALLDHSGTGTASKSSLFTYETAKVTTKSCSLAIAKKVRNALHGACESVYQQVAAISSDADKGALEIINVSSRFNMLHVGNLAEAYYNAVIGGTYPVPPAASVGTCMSASTAADSGFSSGQVAETLASSVGTKSLFNSECEDAMIQIYAANGGLTGADGSAAIATTTIMDSLLSANGWPASRYDTAVRATGKSTEFAALRAGYMAPNILANYGTTFFTVSYPGIAFDADMTAAKCQAWIEEIDTDSEWTYTAATKSAPAYRALTVKGTDSGAYASATVDGKISDRIVGSMKIVGLTSTAGKAAWSFTTVSSTSADVAGTYNGASSIAKALYDECILKDSGGVLVDHTVTTNVLDRTKVPSVSVTSGKTGSADRDTGAADCPTPMRTALKTIMSKHCFVGSTLVNPDVAGTYYAAFEAALQLRSNADSTGAGTSPKMYALTEGTALADGVSPALTDFRTWQAGILPQVLAQCGYTDPVATCAVGMGGATAGACTSCAKGKYSAVTTVTVCSDCEKGKYADQTANSAAAHCKTCPKGKWSASAASSCTLCAAGTYGDAAGLSAAAACKNCTSGSTTAGASASSNCSKTDATDATTKASGALSRFSALAITSLLALIAM